MPFVFLWFSHSHEQRNMYLDRCEQLKQAPPDDWSGVFVMQTK